MFESMVEMIAQGGYVAVFLLMLAENLFPPIPSEAIMPLAGFAAARGDLSLTGVIVAGTLGSVAGAIPWYLAGLWFGRDRVKRLAARFGRWMTVSPADVDRAIVWFQKYGYASVFFGRLIPTIRTVISTPAGLVRMPLAPFFFFTVLGSALWTGLLAVAGYVLESQYVHVAEYVDPVSKAVIVAIVVAYVYRVITYRPDKEAPADG